MNHTTNTPDKQNGGFRRLRPEEHTRSVSQPSYTVMASNTMRWVERDGAVCRAVSLAEAAALQTFPPGYDVDCGTVARTRTAIGNALPPEAARRMMLP